MWRARVGNCGIVGLLSFGRPFDATGGREDTGAAGLAHGAWVGRVRPRHCRVIARTLSDCDSEDGQQAEHCKCSAHLGTIALRRLCGLVGDGINARIDTVSLHARQAIVVVHLHAEVAEKRGRGARHKNH